MALLLVLGLAFSLPDRQLWPGGAVLACVLAFAAVTQFSARCPRCGVRIGLYARLVLPRACPRCKVGFRP